MNIKYLHLSGTPSGVIYTTDLIQSGYLVQPIFIFYSEWEKKKLERSLEYILELKKTFGNKLLDLKILDYRNTLPKDNKTIFSEFSKTIEYKNLKKSCDEFFLPIIEISGKKITKFNLIFDYIENEMPSNNEGIIYNCLKSSNSNQNFTVESNQILDYTKVYERKIDLDLPFFDIFKKIILSGDPIYIEDFILKHKNDINILKALEISSFCFKSNDCGICYGCVFKKSININTIINFNKLGLSTDKLLKNLYRTKCNGK
jgi:hypothetical protein